MNGPILRAGNVGPIPLPVGAVEDALELRLYRALTRLARPAAPFILRWRQQRGKEDEARMGERLGRATCSRPAGGLVWLHAASVGETSSILPLMTGLRAHDPRLGLLLTTGTVTSARFAATRLPEGVIHQYVPLDSPSLVASFLDHWRPTLAVFTEQEVWPNLVLDSARRGIPLALVNARMSKASFARWQRRPTMARALFSRFDVVLAQSDALADRFRALGATRVGVAGNLKIDAPAPAVDKHAFAELEQALAGRARILAASTHEGEELALARVHLALRATRPGLVTIVAPRHPERGPGLAEEIAALGLTVTRRAAGELPDANTDIYIADTIGELGTLYALAPVAFIGGSLVRHGGQNPIEAVRRGSVVVTGPHTYNFTEAVEALTASGGALVVADEAELRETLSSLLADPARLEAMRLSATAALERMSGALARTLDALTPYLSGEEGSEARKRAG